MVVKSLVRKNAYYDSVTLMIITNDIKKLEGVDEVLVGMGTEHNISLAKELGLYTPDLEGVTANDFIISIRMKDENVFEKAVAKVDELLASKKEEEEEGEIKPQSLDSALSSYPDANLVLISVPGQFAKREAKKALMADRHVHLFSDNVTIEEELELKK
ncbi:MAG TPA: FdrA family protein, partial [Candidatus Atribacteria bacterium]|nr:FdrA family protein [Candidatus Atribacteria bacterium]